MKKLWVVITVMCLTASLGVTAYADQTEKNIETMEANQETTAAKMQVDCTFSEPVITIEGGKNVYKSTLTLHGNNAMEGYQIKVKAENQDSIVIENKSGGTATQNVYKNGAQHLAVMTGKLQEGEVTLCEITARYPFSNQKTERTLEVSSLEIVTSVSEEKIESAGPFTLVLPYAEPPFYANIKFYVLLAGLAGLIGILVFWKKKGKKASLPSEKICSVSLH